MKRAILEGLVKKVSTMDKQQVEDYAHVVSLSNVDKAAKKELNEAIDTRFYELDTVVDNKVVSSDFDLGGGDYDN